MNADKRAYLPYLACTVLVAVATVFGQSVKTSIEPTNLVMVYLLLVVIAAVRWGRGPAAFVSVIGVLAFDFFLVPPYLTFDVAHVHYIFTFIGLFVVGLVIGSLASRMREKTIEANRREAQTAALQSLSADLAGVDATAAVLRAIRSNVAQIFDCAVAIFLPAGESLEMAIGDPDFPSDESDRAPALRAFGGRASVEAQPPDSSRGTTRYLPLDTPQGAVGVLAVSFRRRATGSTREEQALLDALANQAAVAIQRAKLAEESRQIELMKRTEKLHSALLSSISHDLRTPLVSITGTLTALLDESAMLDESTKRELLETAAGESGRLNRLVGNLLDMTRMEAGELRIEKKPCELRDVVGASLEQLADEVGSRAVRISIPRDYPEVPMDFRFMMKVFCNVIDNAVKYSGANAPIDIRARTAGRIAYIEIADAGTGIPEGDLKRVFDKFYRAERQRRVTGTGLGLSISKGIVEAHGGEIAARNNEGGGATVTVSLPLGESAA